MRRLATLAWQPIASRCRRACSWRISPSPRSSRSSSARMGASASAPRTSIRRAVCAAIACPGVYAAPRSGADDLRRRDARSITGAGSPSSQSSPPQCTATWPITSLVTRSWTAWRVVPVGRGRLSGVTPPLHGVHEGPGATAAEGPVEHHERRPAHDRACAERRCRCTGRRSRAGARAADGGL